MTGGNFEVSIDASLPTTSRLCEDRNYLTKRNYDRFDLTFKIPKTKFFHHHKTSRQYDIAEENNIRYNEN